MKLGPDSLLVMYKYQLSRDISKVGISWIPRINLALIFFLISFCNWNSPLWKNINTLTDQDISSCPYYFLSWENQTDCKFKGTLQNWVRKQNHADHIKLTWSKYFCLKCHSSWEICNLTSRLEFITQWAFYPFVFWHRCNAKFVISFLLFSHDADGRSISNFYRFVSSCIWWIT